MSKYATVGLYDHNIESYEKVESKLKEDNIAAIVHATGTGKSYNALQLAYDNKDKKITYIVPSNSIIEHLKEIIKENNLENSFKNLNFITYQSLIDLTVEELSKLDIDLLILDEFHHIGAPVWGEKVNTIVNTHKNMKIFGMTAYTVRDRGTIYERDMANPETDELFSNKVVSNYDLCDAMIDGVLPKPIYKSGYVFLEQTVLSLEEKINKLNQNSKDYKELYPLLQDIKRRLNEALSVKDIFKINIKKDGKYIYFCPVTVEQGKNDIDTIKEEVKSWIKEMGLTEDDYELYVTTSQMGKLGKENRVAFYNDVDLKGNKTNNKLRIMFAINQYNEGVHAPGLDGVIMGRSTQSDIVYFEQLGRALSIRGKNKEEYDKLNSKPIEELIEFCSKRNIKINDITSKEEIIEQLLAPIIIDLANNISFIKNLENDLKDRVKEIQTKGPGNKRVIHLGNTSFDIDMLNENLFEILRYMYDRLTLTWEDKYKLAKSYYEYHGNLKIPRHFKTINGYEYDENGISLSDWMKHQKEGYYGKNKRKLSQDQIEKLKAIGMSFRMRNKQGGYWLEYYQLAKKYYEHYGNLEIPHLFKTINGYEYNENGMLIGEWIARQRNAYKGIGGKKISSEQIELLKEIGMRFETKKNEDEWQKRYELAKKYYEHYGNLEIPHLFKTINGYEYDENGIALGCWLERRRTQYKINGHGYLTQEQIQLLKEIGMRFETKNNEDEWQKKYELAKKYYEYYGNLRIPYDFKTTNGIEYDENGISLGAWLCNQKQVFQGINRRKIDSKQIKLLEEIGINWFSEKIDLKLQSEQITDKNTNKKQKEILNRTISYLNTYSGETMPNIDDLNRDFVKHLDNIKNC